MTDIFDESGRINTGIDPTTIHPDRRDAYGALVAAQELSDQAETELKSANDMVMECVREHDRTQAALPKTTFMDLWRANKSQ